VKIARMIKNISDEQVIVSRWGGEEFLVFAYGEKNYDVLKDSLIDLVNGISGFGFSYKEVIINTTVSIGLTEYQKDDSIDDMVLRADNYLYQAKDNGKNQLLGD
jgi:diguanylate cyclase (GGDEF)-like protein